MKKNIILLIVAFTVVLLSGCFGVDEKYEKGLSLYEKGTEDSLVEAREFFNAILEKDPSDSTASKWVDKIDSKYLEVAKSTAEEKFEKLDIYEAYRIMENLYAIAPDDQEVVEGFKFIEGAYNEQKEFDEFTEHLEESYKVFYDIYSDWDQNLSLGILNQMKKDKLFDLVRDTLLDVATLRKDVQNKNFEIKNDFFITINNELFEYLNSTERTLTNQFNLKSDQEINAKDIKDNVTEMNPESFNNVFLEIQRSITEYLQETDGEGELVHKIKNNLKFSGVPKITEPSNEDKK